MKSAATPRWVSGMPAAAGPASAELSPGTTVTGTPAADAGQPLLAAAAEDERVAALEPHHPLAGARAVDQHRVDLVLGQVVPVRRLAAVDDLDVRVQPVEQLARRQPVDDHDVGLGHQAPARAR